MFGVGSYKTRAGQDVEIVAVVKGVAIGYFTEQESGDVEVNTWSESTGRFYIGSVDESGYDLIDPNAKKPIKQDVWLTIYKSVSGNGVFFGRAYATKQEAKEHKREDCIAITQVQIDCMEGDNLD